MGKAALMPATWIHVKTRLSATGSQVLPMDTFATVETITMGSTASTGTHTQRHTHTQTSLIDSASEPQFTWELSTASEVLWSVKPFKLSERQWVLLAPTLTWCPTSPTLLVIHCGTGSGRSHKMLSHTKVCAQLFVTPTWHQALCLSEKTTQL